MLLLGLLILVGLATLALLSLSPAVRLRRSTLWCLAGMLALFAGWSLFGFSYPSAPGPIALNMLSKILALVTVLTLFLPQRARSKTHNEHKPQPLARGRASFNPVQPQEEVTQPPRRQVQARQGVDPCSSNVSATAVTAAGALTGHLAIFGGIEVRLLLCQPDIEPDTDPDRQHRPGRDPARDIHRDGRSRSLLSGL